MGKQSEAVKKWRKNTKQRIVDSMGGKCCICGYNKCNSALDLHHLNPNEKEFGIGKIRANIKSWDKIVKELKKCILVCSNCHAEIHDDILKIPKNYIAFNEDYADYRQKQKKEIFDICPICKGEKSIINITCSHACAAKLSWKVNWDNVDLKKELQTKSYCKIADELGCSDNAVRKRAKRLGLI